MTMTPSLHDLVAAAEQAEADGIDHMSVSHAAFSIRHWLAEHSSDAYWLDEHIDVYVLRDISFLCDIEPTSKPFPRELLALAYGLSRVSRYQGETALVTRLGALQQRIEATYPELWVEDVLAS
jgi:hypothetical protein